MGRINIEIPDDLHKKIRAISALRGITLIDYINETLARKTKEEKL